MSIISSFVVFFLCFSLHACNARLLGVIDKEPKEYKFNLSNKNEEKENSVKASIPVKEKHSLSNKLEVAKKQSMRKEIRVDKEIDQKPLTSNANGKKPKSQRVKISGSVHRTEQSLVSVSWRLPHKKRGEQQPGFNLDYSPPKTHPPVHN